MVSLANQGAIPLLIHSSSRPHWRPPKYDRSPSASCGEQRSPGPAGSMRQCLECTYRALEQSASPGSSTRQARDAAPTLQVRGMSMSRTRTGKRLCLSSLELSQQPERRVQEMLDSAPCVPDEFNRSKKSRLERSCSPPPS